MNYHISIPTRVPENLSLCLDAIYKHEKVTPDDITAIIDNEDGNKFKDDRCKYVISERHRDNAYVHYEGQRQGGDKDIIVCDDDVFLQTPGGFTIISEEARKDHRWGCLLPSFKGIRCTTDMIHQDTGGVREVNLLAFHCVYMRREIADGPGCIDSIFRGFGMQDCDQFVSLRLAGLKIGVCDHVLCLHGTEVSGGRVNPGWEIEHVHNHAAFEKKWGFSANEIQSRVTRP